MITYAQNFEDVMLARLFQGQTMGFYVDIGAWHPTKHSVTKHFYDLGWSGINVEPVRAQHELFVQERPRDTNLNVAVGAGAARMAFFECADLTSLSTASAERGRQLAQEGHDVARYEVDMLPLREVLAMSGGRVVDFLKIDVEGFEAQVLQSADWAQCRPRVLVVEATLPAVKIERWEDADAVRAWDDWEPGVLQAGYVFAWYDGLSRFYVRREEAALADRLVLPAGVHDELQFADVMVLEQKLEALQDDRQNVLAASERLEEQLAALHKDRHDLLAANEQLNAEALALQGDRAAKSEVVDRLVAELEGERAVVRQAQEQLKMAGDGLAQLRAINGDLAASIERLKNDCAAKALVNDQMQQELSAEREARRLTHDDLATALHGQAVLRIEIEQQQERSLRAEQDLLIVRQKVRAKDCVIQASANRDVERKALLKGSADLLYYARRKPVPPGVGDFFSAETPVQGGLHVAVDALEIVFGVSGGVETYMKMLTGALLQAGHRVTIICLEDQLAPLRNKYGKRVGYFVVRKSLLMGLSIDLSNRWLRKSARLSAGKSMATFARLAEDIGANILHSPVQIFSNLDFGLPSVLNLHDLQHLHFPENFRPSDIEARNRLYGLSANLADAIVVSSQFVRDDLVEKMGIPAPKIFTVPVTWDPLVIDGLDAFGPRDAMLRYRLPPNYVIYPAQFWPHKNHVRLVEALRIVRDRLPAQDVKLVLTGYRGHSGWPQVEQAIKRLKLESDVICLDHVPVEHLAGLYKGAQFCVMPSTFEASSYPVIESQVLGVPAMCSNVTSLPELMAHGAGALFNPFDVNDIADKMCAWLQAPEEREMHAQHAFAKVMKDHSSANYHLGLSKAYEFALSRA